MDIVKFHCSFVASNRSYFRQFTENTVAYFTEQRLHKLLKIVGSSHTFRKRKKMLQYLFTGSCLVNNNTALQTKPKSSANIE